MKLNMNWIETTIDQVLDQPVNVKVSMNVISLSSFDSQKMEYSIDIDFEMRWIDFRLANNFGRPVRIREKDIIDKIWRPDPYFVNSKNSYFHDVSFPNFRMRIRPDGLVVYNMRFRPSLLWWHLFKDANDSVAE